MRGDSTRIERDRSGLQAGVLAQPGAALSGCGGLLGRSDLPPTAREPGSAHRALFHGRRLIPPSTVGGVGNCSPAEQFHEVVIEGCLSEGTEILPDELA